MNNIKEWIEKLNSGKYQGINERADLLNYIINALLEVFDPDFLAAMVEAGQERVFIMPPHPETMPDDLLIKLIDYLKGRAVMPFPCYRCENVGNDTPRCDKYADCKKYRCWARGQNLDIDSTVSFTTEAALKGDK
jgi:hypothetical protein